MSATATPILDRQTMRQTQLLHNAAVLHAVAVGADAQWRQALVAARDAGCTYQAIATYTAAGDWREVRDIIDATRARAKP